MIDRRTALSATALAALSSVGLSRDLFAGVVHRVQAKASPPPFVMEYYYKVKWGYFGEFRSLYEKNHYPILKRYQKLGRIVSMSATFPANHASESARWDMRFTIAWKDAATAFEVFDQAPAITRELYPDQALFAKEELRRFELLLEHMDVPVVIDDLAKW